MHTMIRKTVRLTPDQMTYKDRGKMKWQGLMLSDHSEAIKKRSLAQQKEEILPKARLSLIEIGKKLSFAHQNNKPISIQMNTLKMDNNLQEYNCLVAGNYEDEIYFSLKNDQVIKTPLENIRHLELLDPIIWQRLK